VRDPYEVLGLGRGASEAEIKTAFRRLAAIHHPDKNPGDPEASVRFKEANLAHQILSDKDKRAAYDRYGEAAFRPGGGAPGGIDFSDMAGFEDLFGDLLGAFGIRTGDRGDIRKNLELSFEEAALGCEREVSYERLDICEGCAGRGAEPSRLVRRVAAAAKSAFNRRCFRSRSSGPARVAAARDKWCSRLAASAAAKGWRRLSARSPWRSRPESKTARRGR
jgi:molecular chaperone DnaJ